MKTQFSVKEYSNGKVEVQMKTEPQHTIIPWKLQQHGNIGDILEDNKMIASGIEVMRAARIVRAVNSHEELLKQLKSIHRHYQGKDMVNGEHNYVCGACETIAKAEGK